MSITKIYILLITITESSQINEINLVSYNGIEQLLKNSRKSSRVLADALPNNLITPISGVKLGSISTLLK